MVFTKSINKYNLIFPFSLNQRELKHTLLLKDKKTLNPCLQIIRRTTMKYITNKLKTSIYYITSPQINFRAFGYIQNKPLVWFQESNYWLSLIYEPKYSLTTSATGLNLRSIKLINLMSRWNQLLVETTQLLTE